MSILESGHIARRQSEIPTEPFALGSRVRVVHGDYIGRCGEIVAHRILGPIVRLDSELEPLIQFPPRWLEALPS